MATVETDAAARGKKVAAREKMRAGSIDIQM
jgi:hypothetical protein